MRPDGPRAKIIGDDSGPQPPFPFRMKGTVVKGFGRGSKEVRSHLLLSFPSSTNSLCQLGIPTANIPVEGYEWMTDLKSGVYFGWCSIRLPSSHPFHPSTTSPNNQTSAPLGSSIPVVQAVPADKVAEGWVQYPMVMSIGYNPFYKNTVRTAEVHVLHEFGQDFYGSLMAVGILGFIREEYDYVDVESLIGDIREDCEVAKRSLDRSGWREALKDEFFWTEDGIGGKM